MLAAPQIKAVEEAKIAGQMREHHSKRVIAGIMVSKTSFKSLSKIEAEDEEEESEGKYKLVRHHVEKFFKQSKFGKWIEISMGLVSFLSSVAFVVMTYWDLSLFDECCS